jgi:hypothetical protein
MILLLLKQTFLNFSLSWFTNFGIAKEKIDLINVETGVIGASANEYIATELAPR